MGKYKKTALLLLAIYSLVGFILVFLLHIILLVGAESNSELLKILYLLGLIPAFYLLPNRYTGKTTWGEKFKKVSKLEKILMLLIFLYCVLFIYGSLYTNTQDVSRNIGEGFIQAFLGLIFFYLEFQLTLKSENKSNYSE